MIKGFFSSNRSQRESEPRMSDERSRDFGGGRSRRSDYGGAERRDPGEEALLELARLIGQNDPFPSETHRSDNRLADVSRAAASHVEAARDPFMDDAPMRRAPGFREPRASSRAGDGFDVLPLADQDDYPVAPPRAPADDLDYDRGDRRHNSRGEGRPRSYERPYDDYRGDYADGDYVIEPDDFNVDESEAPRRRSRRLIMAVLGLAVFGSAAAYGYRTIVGGAPSGPAPIIRADNSPTKITPMTDVKMESGRISDRIGERLVRRDEDPVDIGSASTGAAAAGQSDIVAPAARTTSSSDPKRVHTVPIRADEGAATSSDRSIPRAATAPVQPAVRQVAAAPQPSPQRQAALTSAASVPAAAAAPVESGGYVVQLAALRSEVDAQTTFRTLQAKYPVLSGHQPLIRRKDQGERGIFFAAQVGPFGAKNDADELCEEVKSAGGSCFVQRN